MKKCLLVLFAWIYAFQLQGQSTSPGFDSLFAQQLQQKLVSMGASGSLKGLSAAAIIPGQGTWVGTWGQAAPGQPLTPDMRLGIASNSKAFIAALLLKLQEEGLLDLDDPVSQYLPPHPHVDGSITLRQLLTHTSGLFDFINDWTAATSAAYSNHPDSVWMPEDILATIGPPKLSPGVRYSYSNTNYLLAGMVAAAAADTSIGYLLHSRIFEPLGLSMAYPPYDDVFAAPYSNLWSGNSVTLSPGNDATFLTFSASAGAIWSTAYDMVRWYDALFGDSWLSTQSQQELRTTDGHSAYALGIRLQNDYGLSFFYHGGAWGFRSYMMHEPASGITVCMLSNHYGSSVSTQAEALFEEILNQKPRKNFDLAVLGIEHPSGTVCPGDLLPVVVSVKNKGLEPFDSVWVKYGEDGVWQDSFLHVLPLELGTGAVTSLEFEVPVPIIDAQKHRFRVSLFPLQEDGYPRDNLAYSDYQLFEEEGLALPYHEGFETPELIPSNWISLRLDNLLDWRRTDFAASEGNSSLARDNYSDGNTGDVYAIELPALKIDPPDAVLNFSFAHVFYPGFPSDKLLGYVSTDCGESFDLLFELSGSDFETWNSTTDLFLPYAFQWQTKSYSLAGYTGENVLIRFVSESGFSNMLYLDDVNVTQAVPVKEEVLPMQVSVSPNPAKEYVEVNVSGMEPGKKLEVQLLTALGQVVLNGKITANGRLQLQRGQLPAGIYFLKLADGNGQIQSRPLVFL